ncbi:Thioredoxin family protein [Quillaja saponaria]|uniref:Thioredoxin family protein n=1 Tax=Quillaja saponaria TaxID=32244 RepID=A0AAD7Q769_QUISA|nr:Thioredoxin family protein [Quillaja saponaria]
MEGEGALNLTQYRLLSPLSFSSNFRTRSRVVSVRAMSNLSESPSPSASSSTTTSGSTKEERRPWSVSSSSFAPPPDFKPPEPKRFTIRSDKIIDFLGALLPFIFRFATGVFASGYSVSFVSKEEIPPDQYALEIAGFKVKETAKLGSRPEKPIEIYEFESCPFCRKVREIVAVLDLDVLFYPCPRNGLNFRPKVAQMGGKQQFPYMVDPNTGVSMYESDDIIKYLVEKYGDGSVPFTLSLGLLTTLTASFAMLGRLGKGTAYTPSKLPPEPLKLWAYEGSPFCKLVREVLVELELPHILCSCARGSPKRQILYQKTGHFQAPYLEDPNTGVQMFESAEIIEYLRVTYALQ